VIFCSIGNNFTHPTWINILRYIHFSTACSERVSLKMGQLWRRISGLGSHLIDLKIWDMILSQKCNNENHLTIWNMKVVFFMHPSVQYEYDLLNRQKSLLFVKSQIFDVVHLKSIFFFVNFGSTFLDLNQTFSEFY
jgi:hypothetical protein